MLDGCTLCGDHVKLECKISKTLQRTYQVPVLTNNVQFLILLLLDKIKFGNDRFLSMIN